MSWCHVRWRWLKFWWLLYVVISHSDKKILDIWLPQGEERRLPGWLEGLVVTCETTLQVNYGACGQIWEREIVLCKKFWVRYSFAMRRQCQPCFFSLLVFLRCRGGSLFHPSLHPEQKNDISMPSVLVCIQNRRNRWLWLWRSCSHFLWRSNLGTTRLDLAEGEESLLAHIDVGNIMKNKYNTQNSFTSKTSCWNFSATGNCKSHNVPFGFGNVSQNDMLKHFFLIREWSLTQVPKKCKTMKYLSRPLFWGQSLSTGWDEALRWN